MPYAILGDLQTLTLESTATMPNACVILTLDNDVILMDNVTLATYTADSTFATLPESMRPQNDIVIPVYLDSKIDATIPVLLYNTLGLDAEPASLNLMPLKINPNGELSIPVSVDNGTLYLNGVTFNVCGTYYNSTIGNNFSQGTSPLS